MVTEDIHVHKCITFIPCPNLYLL